MTLSLYLFGTFIIPFLNPPSVPSPYVAHRKVLAERYIMTAAKLIAPAIETSFATGFDWLVTVVF